MGLAVAALALGACGTQSKLSNQQSVSSAITNLGAQPKLEVAVSLGLDATQIQQLSTHGGASKMTAAQAQALSQASVFFIVQSGHGENLNSDQFSSDAANRYDFGVKVGSSTPVEIRVIDQSLYARVDASSLAAQLGQSAAATSKLGSQLQQADALVPGLSALAQGSWIKVSTADLKAFSQLAGGLGSSQAGSGSSAGVTGNLSKLSSQIIGALRSNTTYKDQGSSGGQTVYSVTVDVRALVQQVEPLLQQALSSLPSSITGRAAGASSALGKVPAGQTVVFTMYVKDGKATEVDLDLKQFDQTAPFSVPLRLAFSQPTQDVAAPDGATQLDLSKLPSMLSGLAGGASHSGTSSTSG